MVEAGRRRMDGQLDMARFTMESAGGVAIPRVYPGSIRLASTGRDGGPRSEFVWLQNIIRE